MNGGHLHHNHKTASFVMICLEVAGTFVGQSFRVKKHLVTSIRVLLISWLIFSFIIGTAYKGNLIASLATPRYPSRPETLDQLVKAVDKLSIGYSVNEEKFLRSIL